MSDRRLPGLLALAGAVLLGLGCWLPYVHQSGADFEIFQRHGYRGQLYYAVEPAVVMVLAAVLGVMLLRSAVAPVWSGVLIAVGVQTVLLWVGYLGYSLTASEGGQSVHLKEGGSIGLAGSLLISAAGAVALRATSDRRPPPPAGWYADPTGAVGLRYWSGSFWTEHTAERAADG